MSVDSKMTAIADGIREKTGKTGKLTLDDMASGVDEVYEAGMSKAESDFWDAVQNYGKRTFYEYAFNRWNCEYIRPKYKVIADSQTRLMQTFSENKLLKKVESAYFDFSNHMINTGSGYAFYNTFGGCSSLEEIEDVGLQTGNYNLTFHSCNKLHTIAILRVAETDTFTGVFTNCYALENVTIEGVIGQNGFNVSPCTKLTHTSLMSIINSLKDYSGAGTTKTVTLGSTNLAKLTDEEKAIAVNKGWTLA